MLRGTQSASTSPTVDQKLFACSHHAVSRSINPLRKNKKKKICIPRCVERRRRYVDFNSRFSPYYFLSGIRLERMECLVAFRSLQPAGPYHPTKKRLTSFVPFEKKKPKFFCFIYFYYYSPFSWQEKKGEKISLRVQFKLECAFSIFQGH